MSRIKKEAIIVHPTDTKNRRISLTNLSANIAEDLRWKITRNKLIKLTVKEKC